MNPAAIMLTGLSEATPLLLAALGEMIVERSGRVNLGVEGMMAVGAAAAAYAGVYTGSLAASLAFGALAACLLALVYVVAVVILGLDQIVVGLILVFMGKGLADIIGSWAGGAPGTPLTPIPGLGIDLVETASLALPPILWLILYHSWLGVELRAVGEDEEEAAARGINVRLVRGLAVLVGAALAGIGGAYVADAFHYGRWFSGVTEGLGWIAIADVILGYWHPLGVLAACYLTGLLFAVKPLLPVLGVPAELVDAAPYLAVLAAQVVATVICRRLGLTPPASVWWGELTG
ncbi:MAG: ABC transporter permease [Crenarchaeota archaeon]|nr:ABC transporter permease [Thermoproteota archaeon]